MAFERTSLKIKIGGNIFSCGCENLDFILWLMDTPVIFDSDRDFPCIQDNGTMTGTAKVVMNQLYILRHCTGKLLLSLTVTCMIVVLTSVFITYVISKNPTRYRNIVIRRFGFGVEYLAPKQFEFTFYVGYCGSDVPFVYRILRPGLELCIRPVRLFLKDREVLPGQDIAEGIIEGVNGSWKTILVISNDFLEDSWTHFTVTSALYAMSDVILNRVIVLLVGGVLMEDLPERVLNMVEEDCMLRVKDYMDMEGELCEHLRHAAGL
ncbi:LOW QUALITY PROTEIN: toll-like receptor 5 [Haliotis rubra]|uniref:LOW QUALITY PROTEIN: toll-like receptor 5 n=1 Tax=Haliotis rubra TaxID=36100 RepID=UPI001EE605DC|nr:LOW QUALITY PROTEIN: toll-like receptor 5 [Haliotis rubra]